MNAADFERSLVALTVWREAQGEGRDGMAAVAHVIANRQKQWGSPWRVVTSRWQFSSMTAPGDGMLVKWPYPGDPNFDIAMAVTDAVLDGTEPDPTGGATSYCNLDVAQPAWAKTYTQTAKIGRHTFFKP